MTVNGIQNTAGQMVASKVLFNFYEDYGTLTLPNVMGGSVLAPFATWEAMLAKAASHG